MKSFDAFNLTGCDKGFNHRYDLYYDKIFENFKPESLLEIGVRNGRSLASWKLMFPSCQIEGVDITKRSFIPSYIDFSSANIIIGDSTKLEIVSKLKDSYDVIIDDGSHYYRDIARTFRNLHTKFNKYYIIEDWYYDVNMALRYINNFGFSNIEVYKSKNSNMKILDNRIFTHRKTKKWRRIDQNMIVISR